MIAVELNQDVVSLTEQLVNIESVSHREKPLADAVEFALQRLGHLRVWRDGNTVLARTELGRDERVVIAGHLDTVPANGNLPASRAGGMLWGLGSCDMKGGVAVALRLAATVANPARDVTYVFYEAEEVEDHYNGLGRAAREYPDQLAADFAILMEPSNAVVEAGCQGTMRFDVTLSGERAHSARWWMGENAIHAAAPVLQRLVDYRPRSPVLDGLTYREGLNAVGIDGGVAGNVLPDVARVTINFRYAPDRSEAEALDHVRKVFDGHQIEVTDSAPGALPGLDRPAAAAFVRAVGGEVNPKYGWTDVARFASLGVPAVNFGPGDPMFAHKQDEHVPVEHLQRLESQLDAWLRGELG